ncbi:MAG: NAD(P)-dependent alcohol dehydrogenase [Candidatus Thorarchaeota archaeon]|nr:NAD(P)-dependent alcohol dehydrogenase [Candidatus Thorarchaeota archaeon]
MKAVLWTKYGPPEVLQLKEIEKPSPKANELLIKIHATTVTSGDCEMRSMKPAILYRIPMRLYIGLRRPSRINILGMELAGEVEEVGAAVGRFKPGDQVFAATGIVTIGTYTEYICFPEESEDCVVAQKPKNMTFEEAAPVPMGGLEALNYLRQGNVSRGDKVLINGAGGTIGTYAVQLAKYFGADVTAVDSAEKLEMLRTIGADQVVDFAQDDFTKTGETYDFILDLVGKSRFADVMSSLQQNGRYLTANPSLSTMIRGRWMSLKSDKKAMSGRASARTEDLLYLKGLIEAGELKSVIDRIYPLEDIAEAHRYVETGHKKGNVVVTIVDSK